MLFKKKKNKNSMSIQQIKLLDRRPLKYVTSRDSGTYKEKKLGENGAVNIMNNQFVLVCEGKNVMRCDLDKVSVAELMNLSGITVKGFDQDTQKELSVIAYFSDGVVGVARRK